MAKQNRPAATVRPLGRLTYPYYDRPGFKLSFGVTAYPDRYAIAIWWNGAECRRAARKSLAGALTWAGREADRLIESFGMPAKQVALGDLLAEVERRLAA